MENQKKMFTVRRLALAVVMGLTFVIGISVGASGEPVPVTETKTVEVEKEVRVEVTPEACLHALNNADLVNMTSGQGFDLLAQGMTAAESFDVAGMQDAIDRLEVLAPELQSALETYEEAAAACRQ